MLCQFVGGILLSPEAVNFSRKWTQTPKNEENLERWESINQALQMSIGDGLGSLDLSNLIGITLEYSLTMEGGIAASTVINSAKVLANRAKFIIKIITLRM